MARARDVPVLRRWAEAVGVVGVAYLAGSVPFANLAARLTRDVDLREVGNGTVSGTSLYRVAGFGPLAAAGILEVAKGAVGPVLAGPRRPVLSAVAGAAAISGHNWSVFLGGAGGRGISPALGALLGQDAAGAAVLLGGLAAGRLTRQTAVGSLVADVALVPVLARRRGRAGVWLAVAVLLPLLAKRLAGNAPAPRPSAYVARLLFDRDTFAGAGAGEEA